jgi:hypothetical protein
VCFVYFFLHSLMNKSGVDLFMEGGDASPVQVVSIPHGGRVKFPRRRVFDGGVKPLVLEAINGN